jgi:hypothetical protein
VSWSNPRSLRARGEPLECSTRAAFAFFLSPLDIILLIRSDFAEADVSYISPPSPYITFVCNLVERLPVECRPFLDQIQFGVQVTVCGWNRVLG